MDSDSFEKIKKITKMITGTAITKEFYEESLKFAGANKLLLDTLDGIPDDRKPSIIVTTFTMMLAKLNNEQRKKTLLLVFSVFFNENGAKELSKAVDDMNYLAKNLEGEEE